MQTGGSLQHFQSGSGHSNGTTPQFSAISNKDFVHTSRTLKCMSYIVQQILKDKERSVLEWFNCKNKSVLLVRGCSDHFLLLRISVFARLKLTVATLQFTTNQVPQLAVRSSLRRLCSARSQVTETRDTDASLGSCAPPWDQYTAALTGPETSGVAGECGAESTAPSARARAVVLVVGVSAKRDPRQNALDGEKKVLSHRWFNRSAF